MISAFIGVKNNIICGVYLKDCSEKFKESAQRRNLRETDYEKLRGEFIFTR